MPPLFQLTFSRGCNKKALMRVLCKFKGLDFSKRHCNYEWNQVVWSEEIKIKLLATYTAAMFGIK